MGCCFYSNSLTDPRGAGTVCHLTSGETEAPLHWACGTVASQLPTAWLLSPRGPWEPAAFHNRALTAGGSHRPAGPSESGPRWPALPHPPQGGLFSKARPRRIPHSQEGWHPPPRSHSALWASVSSSVQRHSCPKKPPRSLHTPAQGIPSPERREGLTGQPHLQGRGPVQLLGLLQPQGDHGDSDPVTRTGSSKCRPRLDPAAPSGRGVHARLLP